MSVKREPIGPVPEETVRVARAVFPRGIRAIQLRDTLGAIYDYTRLRRCLRYEAVRRRRPGVLLW